MKELVQSSLYFGMVLSVAGYLVGVWLKKKTGFFLFNPILVAEALIILFLLAFDIDHAEYNRGAVYLSYFLTPATVCLAIPLYRQLELLKKNAVAIFASILAGVAGSAASIFAMSVFFRLDHVYYVSLLPKSITTAIGMGVSEELGGIVTLTVVSIIVTGIFGNVIADVLFSVCRIEEPMAKGLALGTAAHAIGTARALELGEVEGAMSSLAIAVAGLTTVVAAPMMSGFL